MAAAVAVYFAWRPASPVALGVIGTLSAAAIGYGVWRFRPRYAVSWCMVAVAVALDAYARIVYDHLPGDFSTIKSFAWIVWAMNLIGLVLLLWGGFGLVRSTVRGLSAAIDIAMITLGVGLIAAILIAIPYATGPGVGGLMGAIRVVYVARDVFVLALVIHIATSVRSSRSVLLFTAALLGFVIYDVLFRISRIHGVRPAGTVIDLPWMLFFVAIGAAALVAAMTMFDTPISRHGREASPLRLGMVAILGLLPSVVLLVGLFREPSAYQPIIVVASTLVLILALARIIDVAVQFRRQVLGERVLRDAVTDLAAATDAPSVGPILERAVDRLLAPGAYYRVALLPGVSAAGDASNGGANQLATAQSAGQVAPSQVTTGQVTTGQIAPGQIAPGQLAPGQLAPGQVVTGQVAATDAAAPQAAAHNVMGEAAKGGPAADQRGVVGGDDGYARDQHDGRATDVVGDEVYTRTNHPADGYGRLGRHGLTLTFPLMQTAQAEVQGAVGATPGAEGEPVVPTLVVRGERARLHAAAPRLAVLAAQAGSALDRIRLNEENTRHISESYFRTLVQNSTDIILIVDDDDRIRYASPSAASVFGALPLRGVALPGLTEQPTLEVVKHMLAEVRASGSGTGERAANVMIDNYGDWIVQCNGAAPARVEVSCRDLRADSSIGGLVLTLRNVTQQRLLEHELEQRAFHDPLTGLGNRLPFFERLEPEMARHQTGGLTGLLYADLDDLKMVNDAFGHEIGDVVLTAVGERLKAFVADNGGADRSMAARLGGDEFAVLLTSLGNAQDADDAAEALVELLAVSVTIAGHEVSCGASVGVATSDADAETGQDLLRNADLALYAAKGTGKGQWRHYEQWMRTTVMARLEVRSSLERAIDDQALSLEYQPIVGLSNGVSAGFEALLRWNHPTRGRLSPDEFIDVAEESGLIAPIGEWVLGTAIKAAEEWAEYANTEAPYVGVNVSPRQFRMPGFADTVDRLLGRSHLRPNRLMLEITESLLLRDDDIVWQDLKRLRRLGVRIAIDDFGTGYSALSYLRHVPLDVIKLDRSFIQSMGDSDQQRELVQGIVGLAEVLGLQVTAEGIETEHERDVAAEIGCAYGQGFLFSPPMPQAAVRDWLARPARTPFRRPNSEAAKVTKLAR